MVEVAVVVLIVGILASIAVPVLSGHRDTSKGAQAKVAVEAALRAARSYYVLHDGTYTGFNYAAMQAIEPALLPGRFGGVDALWSPNGQAGLASNEPNRGRIAVTADGGCVALGALSRGPGAFAILDSPDGCTLPDTWTLPGTVIPPGTYYNVHRTMLHVATQDIWRDGDFGSYTKWPSL